MSSTSESSSGLACSHMLNAQLPWLFPPVLFKQWSECSNECFERQEKQINWEESPRTSKKFTLRFSCQNFPQMNRRVLKVWGMEGNLASEERTSVKWRKLSDRSNTYRQWEQKETESICVKRTVSGSKTAEEKVIKKEEQEQEQNVIGECSFTTEDLFMWNLPNE